MELFKDVLLFILLAGLAVGIYFLIKYFELADAFRAVIEMIQ